MTRPTLITEWLSQLKAGEGVAAQKLWEEYFEKMVWLARQKLEGAPRTAADEEDVALSAFKSFCLGVREGRFSQLTDAHNLWPLLMAITINKSVDLIRHQNRQKRGGTGKADDSDSERTQPTAAVTFSELLSDGPDPAMVAELTDQLDRLLVQLDATGDVALRQIAVLKLDGYSNVDIAEQLGCVRRSVERKLQVIAKLWMGDEPHE
ncbi:MAG: hypothetical protein KDA88_17370 [Planctomycetaceae bacterium]|nr:hypothetical protein [Planctomycetaceae bacterium]MCB9950552.1 RNA polymerase subunit sigma-70 [Planctomycetaceae bacterium]